MTTEERPAGRNLVILCDGTSNHFWGDKTNVARLAKVLVRDDRQLVYYDPGVGTLPEPALLSKAYATLRRWVSLALGFGLTRNVEEAYSYLMDHWEPGDRVFLFGFSRGAYTVRVLAGLLHAVGLLPKGNHQLVPYLIRLYSSIRDQDSRSKASGESEYWQRVNEFRGTFSRTLEGRTSRRFPTHFLGAWDTVSSVGWFWEPVSFPSTAGNPSVAIVRHAVSIDERRCFFRQNLFDREENPDVLEVWFPGAHADVGGGYGPDEGCLWKFAFQWMIEEAKKSGLEIEQDKFSEELRKTPDDVKPVHIHDALRGAWWLAEALPKRVYVKGKGRRFEFGRGRRRHVHRDALIHRKALEFMRTSELRYSPSNLSQAFRDQVASLPDKPPEYLKHSD